MKFNIDTAEMFIPDGKPESQALSRTTHMALATHQDDIEIMAYHGVLSCFGIDDKWFGGVVVTNGAGSPRDDLYADYTDDRCRTCDGSSRRRRRLSASTAPGAARLHELAVKDPGELSGHRGHQEAGDRRPP